MVRDNAFISPETAEFVNNIPEIHGILKIFY
jgi:hypothetical protein